MRGPQSRRNEAGRKSGEGLTVLLLSPRESDAPLLVSLLSSPETGITPRVVHSPGAEQGLEAAAREKIDVVITDDTLFEEVRKTRLARDYPVVVLGAQTDPVLTAPLVAKGAQDYLAWNSLDPPVLARVLRHAVARHGHTCIIGDSIGEWHATFDTIPDPIVVVDDEGRIVKTNRKMAAFLHVPVIDAVGKNFFALLSRAVGPDGSDGLCLAARNVPSSGMRLSLGGRRFMVMSHRVEGKSGLPIGTVIILHDITETERITRELRQSRERLEILFRFAPDAYFLLTGEGVIVDCNLSVERLVGYSKEELRGQNLYDKHIITSDYLKQATDCFIKRRFSHPFGLRKIALRHKDGRKIPVEINAFPVEIQGTPMVLVLARDVTEREKAEAALRQSESRYRALVEDMPALVFRFFPDGTISFANEAFCTYFGKTREEVIGANFFEEFIPPQARNRVRKHYLSLSPEHPMVTYEHKIQTPEGVPRWQMWTDRALFNADGEIVEFQSVGVDITRAKMAEQELQKIQKLESLGVLAGGIAHDFNNILTAILGNLSIARLKVHSPAEIKEILDTAEKVTMRARDLTLQLLTFAKGGSPIKKVSSLAELLKECASFFASGGNVKCECAVPEDLPYVNMDPGQISQVLQNLLINAKEAMPEGGTIRIRACTRTIGRRSSLPLQPGEYVMVEVSDEGCGIPEEIQPKIFDPYFTTKQNGNGLGLASAYSIISKHRGHITVSSRPVRGTTFTFYLPATREHPAEEKVSTGPVRGRGRVLVMDDEEIVREIAARILTELGYEVETARNGDEVLAFFQGGTTPPYKVFDAVIMDLTVPGGLGGLETMKRLMRIDPRIKVIVSSGYSTDPVMSRHREYGFKACISKPYEIEELGRVLYKVITGDE